MKYILILIGLTFFNYMANAQSTEPPKGKLILNEEAGIKELQEAYKNKKKKLEGYRVQLYNGRKDACNAKRADFKKAHPGVEVYTSYEAPEYRLQAGDFRTKMEAEKFLATLGPQFSDSFVVKTTIEFPPLN